MTYEERKTAAREALKNGMSTAKVIKKFHLKPQAVGGMKAAFTKWPQKNGRPKVWVKATETDPDFREVDVKKPTVMERLAVLETNASAALNQSALAVELANRIAKEIGLEV